MTTINNNTRVVMATNKTMITRDQFNSITSDASHPLYKKAVMLHEQGQTIYYINN